MLSCTFAIRGQTHRLICRVLILRLCSVTFCCLLALTCSCILTISICFLVSFLFFTSLCSIPYCYSTGSFTYNLLKYSPNWNLDVFLGCTVIWIRLSLINFIKFYSNFHYFFSSNAILLIFIFTLSHFSLIFISNYDLFLWYFALWYINSIRKSYWQWSCLGLHFKMQMQLMNFSIFSRILFSWKG